MSPTAQLQKPDPLYALICFSVHLDTGVELQHFEQARDVNAEPD